MEVGLPGCPAAPSPAHQADAEDEHDDARHHRQHRHDHRGQHGAGGERDPAQGQNRRGVREGDHGAEHDRLARGASVADQVGGEQGLAVSRGQGVHRPEQAAGADQPQQRPRRRQRLPQRIEHPASRQELTDELSDSGRTGGRSRTRSRRGAGVERHGHRAAAVGVADAAKLDGVGGNEHAHLHGEPAAGFVAVGEHHLVGVGGQLARPLQGDGAAAGGEQVDGWVALPGDGQVEGPAVDLRRHGGLHGRDVRVDLLGRQGAVPVRVDRAGELRRHQHPGGEVEPDAEAGGGRRQVDLLDDLVRRVRRGRGSAQHRQDGNEQARLCRASRPARPGPHEAYVAPYSDTRVTTGAPRRSRYRVPGRWSGCG